jgi:transcription antitermination factor NusG
MSDIETPTEQDAALDPEILDVTILEEEFEEPVAESAFDRPGRWYIVHTFAGHEQKVIGAQHNLIKSFYVIGSTPGVTGFVGAEKTRPTALTRREVDNIIRPHVEGVEPAPTKRRMPTHEFEVNDTVQIKTGPFATFSGHVAEINEDQLKVKVLVDIFGRETPVELDFTQVTKL